MNHLKEVADAELAVVDDDGPGVPPAEVTGIFERFTRGSSARPGGSGLGLAIVREAARAAGGDAQAENLPGGGLRVRVHVPPAPVAAPS